MSLLLIARLIVLWRGLLFYEPFCLMDLKFMRVDDVAQCTNALRNVKIWPSANIFCAFCWQSRTDRSMRKFSQLYPNFLLPLP